MSHQSSNLPDVAVNAHLRSRGASKKPFGIELHAAGLWRRWTYSKWYRTARDRDKAREAHLRMTVCGRPFYGAVLDVMR